MASSMSNDSLFPNEWWLLTKNEYKLLETQFFTLQHKNVDERTADVSMFWFREVLKISWCMI